MNIFTVNITEWKNKTSINPKTYKTTLSKARKGLTGAKELDESIVDSIISLYQSEMIGYHYSLTVGKYRNKVVYSIGVSW